LIAPLILAAAALAQDAGHFAAGASTSQAPSGQHWTVDMQQTKTNRLAREKSPYLLQHAHNPVDWYPWGPEAFERAKKEDKPIFLSIGYSTCHWCHVMEHESFESPEIAAVLNRHFVPVKLDREERPDVDRIYMTAANAAGWGGGWPLNLWLTPDLKPFYGGTYFPPESKWGRPGLPEISERVAELWKTQRAELAGDADKVAEALTRFASASGREAKLQADWLDSGFDAFRSDFDPNRGGFGDAPKFPMPVNQSFLLRYWARSGRKEALDMTVRTLTAMAAGGMYDHVGGGFHRYSVDGQWRVPHFEKMLYDNAQLAVNYIEAFQAAKDPELARVAGETLDYVRREMTHKDGGFFSAEDADSLPPEGGKQKTEGAYYLWTKAELEKLLGSSAAAFEFRYGVRPEGNALDDPHGEFGGKNILFAEHPVAETAKKIGKSEAETKRLLESARKKLLEVRSKRPRPHLDDKVLTNWNGLMISAFAKGAQALEEPEYLEAAQKAARFLRSHLYDPKTRRLKHSWREGSAAVDGMADDYAFVIQGLLDLYEADFDPAWLDWALELNKKQDELFSDKERGGYYMTAADSGKDLLARVKEDTDNVEPSASSIAALNALRLAQFTDNGKLRERAEKTIESLGAQVQRMPRAMPQMLAAVDFATAKSRQVVIVGKRDDPGTQEMLRAVRSRFIPVKIVMLVEDSTKEKLSSLLPFLRSVHAVKGKPTAYVCVHYACDLPTTDLSELGDLLDGKAQ
jgi:uncharacterized protein YyaL (SSP411 family)